MIIQKEWGRLVMLVVAVAAYRKVGLLLCLFYLSYCIIANGCLVAEVSIRVDY